MNKTLSVDVTKHLSQEEVVTLLMNEVERLQGENALLLDEVMRYVSHHPLHNGGGAVVRAANGRGRLVVGSRVLILEPELNTFDQ